MHSETPNKSYVRYDDTAWTLSHRTFYCRTLIQGGSPRGGSPIVGRPIGRYPIGGCPGGGFGSLFTGTLVSQKRAYTCTQQIPPFPRGICGHPFHLRDAPIDRPPCCGMLHCQTARLHDLLGNCPPGLNPGPTCALLRLAYSVRRQLPQPSRRPLLGLLGLRHAPVTHHSPSRPPRGASTPPACAAGRSGTASFARMGFSGTKVSTHNGH